MNPITRAQEEGYDEEEILNFLSNTYPSINKKISQAVKTGYSTKEIINFVSNLFGKSQPKKQFSPGTSQQSIHASKSKEDELKQQQFLKMGASLAGGAVAGRALQNVPYGKIAGQIGNLFGGGNQNQIPQQTARQPLEEAMGQMGASQTPSAPNVGLEVPQGTEPGAEQLLQEMKLLDKVKNLGDKNPPEEVGLAIKSFLTPSQKNWLATKTKRPVEDLVKEVLGASPTEQKSPEPEENSLETSPNIQNPPINQENPLENEEIPRIKEKKSPKKQALLPDGQVGDIEEEKQGIAKIKLSNGEWRNRKLSELIESPEDAAQIAVELLKSFTPEEERSTHHALSFYDDDSKEGYFLFHNGTAYKVGDLSSEEYEKLSKEVVGAKTSGETPWGKWSAGEGSRGAAYNQIIKDYVSPKETRKHKPYKQLLVNYSVFKRWQDLLSGKKRKKS